MGSINVTPVPSNTNVSVQDANNVQVSVTTGNRINLEVTPTPTQTIQLNRGVPGPAGPNAIGGYPINISGVAPQDVLMFGVGEWVNTPQTEIADGGNF